MHNYTANKYFLVAGLKKCAAPRDGTSRGDMEDAPGRTKKEAPVEKGSEHAVVYSVRAMLRCYQRSGMC